MIIQKIKEHWLISVLLAVGLVGGGWYWLGKSSGQVPPKYVLGTVTKGTLIVSVSGSGQVSSSNQVDVKPKVGGDVVKVSVKNGDLVKAGAVLISLNAREALKSVRDAEASLASAKLSLDKIKQPADDLAKLQAEHSLAQAEESKQNAQTDLAKAYDDGFNSVTSAFLGLPTVMTGMQSLLFDSTIEKPQSNINWYVNAGQNWNVALATEKDEVQTKYYAARTKYETVFANYKNTDRTAAPAEIENLIIQSYDTVKAIADSIKTTHNYIDGVRDNLQQYGKTIPAAVTTQQNTLDTYTGSANGYLTNLLNLKQTIKNSKLAITNADRTIAEKTESLKKLNAGTDPLDIQSAELSVVQRVNALRDAQEKLADYSVRAPIDGAVANLTLKKGDSASSGTAAAVIVGQQRLAQISLNEVDVAKIKIGNKATLKFDAISGLNISGLVADIDAIGTVNQGVVTYNVKIAFDSQDDRVKPGMSVSAAIITEEKTDVLLVANSAVKQSGGAHYVEMPNEILPANAVGTNGGVNFMAAPRQQDVVLGSANAAQTEIVSGLNEGDVVVVRTIAATTAAAPTTQSILPIGNNRGGAGGGGNAARALGR